MKENDFVGPPRAGYVGMMLGSGERVFTVTGNLTTPFPTFDLSRLRKTDRVFRLVETWLMDNTAIEADLHGNQFAARAFDRARTAPTQSDKDAAEDYLFRPGGR